ncbi:MAG: hypothetical protein JO035_10835 [Betaproteobacteria bacterium]|nr:hypothetical protein [Betaproteobacteria bacterium]
MSALLASVLAAGELLCEFSDGYRKSYLAELAGDPPRTEMFLVYEGVGPSSANVIASKRAGRKPVEVRAEGDYVHFIQSDGPTVRVTTLTGCTRTKPSEGEPTCTQFSARHAWHFDTTARQAADASFLRQPSGAASGTCEPWRVD